MPSQNETPGSNPSRDGDFELVTLRNGSRAVRHLGHGEVMHPSVGPWQEALRLYVEQPRLAERLRQPGPPLVILDVGLGAATNAVAALTCARELGPERRRALELVSLEVDLAPLRLALADAAGFPFLQPFREPAEALMREGLWEGEGLRWRLLPGQCRSPTWRARCLPRSSSSSIRSPRPPTRRCGRRRAVTGARALPRGRGGGAADDLQRGHAHPGDAAAGGLLRGSRCVHRHEGRDDGGGHPAGVAGGPAGSPVAGAVAPLLLPSPSRGAAHARGRGAAACPSAVASR